MNDVNMKMIDAWYPSQNTWYELWSMD